MVYLRAFRFLSRQEEEGYLQRIYDTCYTTKYPFNVFRYRELPVFEFEPITILYGTNGSGKSTLLNVIAEKLKILHRTVYNRSNFFPDYVQLCKKDLSPRFNDQNLRKSKIITSDDVFDYLIDIRHLNEGADRDREELFHEYARLRHSQFKMKSLAEYETLKKCVDATRGSSSEFVRRHGVRNVDERSNGEEALRFFTEQIEDHAIYLLDEPENSLSAQNQQKLQQFIEESARFFNCQFIISTHSPFFLATKGAKIYNLDATPPAPEKWTNLPNVRAYYELFEEHRKEFQE